MTEADSDLRDIMPFDFESSDGELGPATISDNRGDIICTLNVDDAEFDGDPEGIIRLREKAMRYLTEVSRIGGVVVTDEMVDRAAQAAYESQTFATDLPWAEVKTDRWHRAARAALHSALGQGEE